MHQVGTIHKLYSKEQCVTYSTPLQYSTLLNESHDLLHSITLQHKPHKVVVQKHNLHAKFWQVSSLKINGYLKAFSGVYEVVAMYITDLESEIWIDEHLILRNKISNQTINKCGGRHKNRIYFILKVYHKMFWLLFLGHSETGHYLSYDCSMMTIQYTQDTELTLEVKTLCNARV